jgi:membrane protein DedA with SNARE-associated domain
MSKLMKFLGLGVLAIVIVGLVFWGASYVAEQDSLKMIIEKFGVLGIFLVSFVANLNLIVPLHAATFSPVFIAAGFSIPVIIIAIGLGTTAADLISYVLGKWGKSSAREKFPNMHARVDNFLHTKKRYVLPGIFFYSAFVPFPNELVMLPLGLMGYKLRRVLIPLILGTVVNTTIFTLGFTSVFNLLFS